MDGPKIPIRKSPSENPHPCKNRKDGAPGKKESTLAACAEKLSKLRIA
jgi:hypothetical protein